MTRRDARGMMAVAQAAASGVLPSAVNIGKGVLMSTTPVIGGVALQTTQLISQRLTDGPRQLLVNLKTPTRGASGVSPWFAPWNGTSTPPSSLNFSAPRLPDPTKGLRVELRWGAGGTAQVAQFDYPAAGACFGVTADMLDLDVLVTDKPPALVYASQSDVPFVGAYMVEGIAADPTPLRWLEAFSTVETGGGPIYWAVKPFARRVRFATPVKVSITWTDSIGGQLYQEVITPPALGEWSSVVLDIPAQATVMEMSNVSGAEDVGIAPEWLIGFV